MGVELYLALVDSKVQQMVLPLINYIEENFSEAVFDDSYSEKTKIPHWCLNDSYVGIGCRKHYISIYFGNNDAVKVVSDNTPVCRAKKNCVNFSYHRELPYDAILKGIDYCFDRSRQAHGKNT